MPPAKRRRHRPDTAHARQPGFAESLRTRTYITPILLGVLTLIVAAVMFDREMAITGNHPGGALDDSWIHYTIARNFADGYGWSFNKGIPTGGSTAPLYTFLLAIAYFVFGEVVIWSKIIGILSLFVAGWFSSRLYRSLAGDDDRDLLLSLATGAWVILSPSLAWAALSGMELTMYLAIAAVGLWLVFSGRSIWGAVVLALSVWCRPDGGWLLGFGLLAVFSRDPKAWRTWLLAGIAAIAVLIPYFAFNYAISGHLFPGTVSTKSGFGFSWTRTSRWIGEFFNLQGVPYGGYEINHPIIWIPLWLAGAILTWRRSWPLGCFVVTFPLVFSAFYPNASSHQRYLFPIIPPAMVLGVLGIREIGRLMKPAHGKWAVGLVTAAVLVWTGSIIGDKAERLGWNVQNINAMHVRLGMWLKTTTATTDTIAVNDVGAIGYHADRFIVDLVGLVTPAQSFWENIDEYHPDYLLIFPDWFKKDIFVDMKKGKFTKRFEREYRYVTRVTLRNNTVVARSTMYVFKKYYLPPAK